MSKTLNELEFQELLYSYGFDPEDDEASIQEDRYWSILDRMEREYGEPFVKWLNSRVDATDGWFYLKAGTWEDLYQDYLASVS